MLKSPMGNAARRRVSFVVAVAVALLVAGAVPVSGAAPPSCADAAFSAGVHTLHGTLCRPANGATPRVALILLHGATYDRTYWDFPVAPARYSALRRLAAAGYLTLALDRLGSGESDRPPASEVTADARAEALHDVVTTLQTDPRLGTTTGKVLLVGHSLGSVDALREAAQYHDVDDLVLTGFLHSAGPGAAFFAGAIHPAAADPKFASDTTIPAGYVTTQPGTRQMFYYAFNADERVYRADEANKDAMAGGDPSLPSERDSDALASQIDVPVLSVVGAQDDAFCTPPNCPEAAREQAAYPLAPSFQVIVRPRTGHDLNLHLNAGKTTDLIRNWIDQHA
jgi:pimeloyl-ACP methyl ester carboxylesterase